MVQKIAKTPLVKFFISFKLTVVCLLLLMVLTFWGTLHQIDYGLYVTQSRMFNSWFFTALGFIPFPGARTILWLALINLVFVTLFRFQYRWNKLGIWFTHLGMILLIISGGITLHFAQESSLTLDEGQGSSVSSDYHHWELSFWTQQSQGDSVVKEVKSYLTQDLKTGQVLENPDLGVKITLDSYFPNSRAFRSGNLLPSDQFINGSGINEIRLIKANADPSENMPGIILSLTPLEGKSSGDPIRILLFGAESTPTSITLQGKRIYCQLRRKRYELPLTLTLVDFIKKDHLGISMAKSFESRVLVDHNHFKREMVISMNQPLRVDNFTFYQSSFTQTGKGESSTLAIVEHPGRMLPYISSIIVGIGLALHFVVMLLKYVGRLKKKSVREKTT